MKRLRKTAYLCRAPLCKHVNVVMEWVHATGHVETSLAWEGKCSRCGRGSFDVPFQKLFLPQVSTLGVDGPSPV